MSPNVLKPQKFLKTLCKFQLLTNGAKNHNNADHETISFNDTRYKCKSSFENKLSRYQQTTTTMRSKVLKILDNWYSGEQIICFMFVLCWHYNWYKNSVNNSSLLGMCVEWKMMVNKHTELVHSRHARDVWRCCRILGEGAYLLLLLSIKEVINELCSTNCLSVKVLQTLSIWK